MEYIDLQNDRERERLQKLQTELMLKDIEEIKRRVMEDRE